MASELPRCIEVSASVSFGAAVEVIKYEYTPRFRYEFSRRYTIPEGWSEQDVSDFQSSKAEELRDELERLAQAEIDSLQEQRDSYDKG